MDKILIGIITGAIGLTGLYVLYVNLFDKEKKFFDLDRFIKHRKDKENELKKKSPNNIIDNLDNKNRIRGVIERGRHRFIDRVKKLLSKLRSKDVDNGNNKDN
jgi:hypothetical protein